MITLLLLLATWYATKLYYTKDPLVHFPVQDKTMGHITCSKCAQTIYTHKDNFRAPYYCVVCK